MNLPFLRFFKKTPASETPVIAGSGPIVAIEKPASERFAKTFVPNSTRQVGAEAPRDTDGGGGTAVATVAAKPASIVLPRISPSMPLPVSTLTPPPPRSISLGKADQPAPDKPEIPEIITERSISLAMSEIGLPEATLVSAEPDPDRRVTFKAADLERGMSTGRPSVRLHAIYQQAPELFSREVEATDPTEVALPFGKVLEQFANFHVRSDQIAEEELPQMETPFLQVTLEDSERFGTSIAGTPAPSPTPPPDQIEDNPPAIEIDPDKPIRLSVPKEALPIAAPQAPTRATPPETLTPAQISPNGTGVPATERVPASSGSPVPTPLPSPVPPTVASPPAAPTGAPKIPLKISPPSDDLRKEAVPKITMPKSDLPKGELPNAAGPRVRLPLRPILRGLAPFQFSGSTEGVAEDATIELPFALIQPQLSLGKISISPAQFQAALPAECREAFTLQDEETPIALPLQEVLQNLPNDSLQIRTDQETLEVLPSFETPFSQKAQEDAARLNPPDATAETSEKISPKPDQPSTPPETRMAPAPTARTPLQVAFDTDERMDAKNVVAQISKLPGVRACAIVYSDGLTLAGNIPTEVQIDGLCAIGPAMMQKCNEQVAGANLGVLAGLTLCCTEDTLTFFGHGNICLAALHQPGEEIAPAIRSQLNGVTRELAQTYTQPSYSPNQA